MEKVSISLGNSKLGNIANISLPPIKSCRPGVPCAKACYARKSYRMYPNVRKSWDTNYKTWETDPGEYFGQIIEWLKGRQENKRKKQIRFFRWHVSGDIPDSQYFNAIVDIAGLFPDVNFLVFTKQYEVVNNCLKYIKQPDNLSIIFSAWPGLEMENPRQLPIAWFNDGTDDRIPENHLECPGNCEQCGMCFQLKKTGLDVVFNKH